MAGRVSAVAKIAERKRHAPVALASRSYLRVSSAAVLPCFRPRGQVNLEGFLFPATYDFLAKTTSRTLVDDQLVAFCQNWNSVDFAYARSKNLTAYDVLKIASMVEKETLAPSERPLVAAVIYNRLHAHMPLGIDATLRYGLHIPPTQSILESQLQSDNPYTRARCPDCRRRRSRTRGSRRSARPRIPRRWRTSTSSAKPDKVHHFFTASDTAFAQYECAHGYGC